MIISLKQNCLSLKLPSLSKGCLSPTEGCQNLSRCSQWSCQRNRKGRSWGSRRVNRGNNKESFEEMVLQHNDPLGIPTGGQGLLVCPANTALQPEADTWIFTPRVPWQEWGFHPPLSSDSSGLLLPELVCSSPLFYTSSIWTKRKAMVRIKLPVKLF